MAFMDKAMDYAEQAADKAAPLLEKATAAAAQGLDAAASSLDKATGGKYHDQIEGVSDKVGSVLGRVKGS